MSFTRANLSLYFMFWENIARYAFTNWWKVLFQGNDAYFLTPWNSVFCHFVKGYLEISVDLNQLNLYYQLIQKRGEIITIKNIFGYIISIFFALEWYTWYTTPLRISIFKKYLEIWNIFQASRTACHCSFLPKTGSFLEPVASPYTRA